MSPSHYNYRMLSIYRVLLYSTLDTQVFTHIVGICGFGLETILPVGSVSLKSFTHSLCIKKCAISGIAEPLVHINAFSGGNGSLI